MQIAAIKFLNALPLTYGLPWAVTPVRPADFTPALVADCDLILAPVYYALEHPQWQIVQDAPAIGCNGDVGTVRVDFTPGHTEAAARTIARSPDSKTSNQLLAILTQHAWASPVTVVPHGTPADGQLIIGDAALATAPTGPTVDLGQRWKEWTSLPFVFAAWMSRAPLAPDVIDQLNAARSRNLANLWPIFARVTAELPALKYHFTRQLVYDFGAAQHEGLARFFAHCKA